MFIAYFKDGSSFSENDGTWDDLPDKGITSLHLTLPVKMVRKNTETGETIELPTPTVHIENYDQYYCAKEAVSLIMALGGSQVKVAPGGEGTVIKHIMAGVDREHGFIIYVELDNQSNVSIKRLPISALFEGERKVVDTAWRKGA